MIFDDRKNIAGLLSIVWIVFVMNVAWFKNATPPHVNVLPMTAADLMDHPIDVPIVDDVILQEYDLSLTTVTKDTFQRMTEEYKRKRMLNGSLAIVFGIAVFAIGTKLMNHWGYGLASIPFGIIFGVIYGYRRR